MSGGFTGNTFGLTIDGVGDSTISGAIATTTGTLTKQGGGTLTISATNTYTGTTTVSVGTLTLGAAGAISDSSALVVANNATFNLAGYNETVASVATSTSSDTAASITLGSGSLTNTLTTAGNASTTFAGVISGTGGSFTKQGTGTLTLSEQTHSRARRPSRQAP